MFSSNISNHTHPVINERYWTETLEFKDKLVLIEKITLIFIAILIILGNTLVLLVTWRERSLHQPNKYFIACLAVADLMVGVFVAPLKVYRLGLDKESLYAMSIHLCRFSVWIDILPLAASVYSLTFVSFDRYLKISKPFKYQSRMTTSLLLGMIFIIWFISTALATYAATPHSGSYGVLLRSFNCPFDRANAKEFYTLAAIIGFFLPGAVTSVMYTLIFVAAHKRQKMLRNGQLGVSSYQNQRTVFYHDLKAIRMLLVILGVFILCWGPLCIYSIIYFEQQTSFGISEKGYLRRIVTELVVFLLPFFNSLCNPVIYAFLDQKYREAFKRLLQRIMSRRQNRTGH